MNALDGTFLSMEELEMVLLTADEEDMADILPVIRKRYGQLHSNHELMMISIDKRENPGMQLKNIIRILEGMK